MLAEEHINSQLLQCSPAFLTPLKTYQNLDKTTNLKDLDKKGGVYGFVCLKTKKQYIGSSSNMYKRFKEHIKGVSSNNRLQRSIAKYGLSNFIFVRYFFHEDPAVILTDIETKIIQSFPFENLFNHKKEANTMLGYKHTAKAIAKMKLRLKDKFKHPMFGQKHSADTLQAISKPGKLNPMYGKTHKIESKAQISKAKSNRPLGLYDLENNLIKTFNNQVE